MLLKFLKDEHPARIAVVFDASGPTFRDALFEQYKAHRPPMPDELRAQVEPLLEAVQGLGLPLLRISGVEADDVIGTLTRTARTQGLQVRVSTGDKDMAQLVDDGVTLINTMSGSVMDRAGVKAKFDVWPEQVIDYLALVGDSADNIPGIPKVGPKTAAKWLGQYGTLDELLTRLVTLQLSVALTLKVTLLRPHWPASALTTMLLGQVITGNSVSFTVTVKVQLVVLPQASVAEQFTVVTPTGKTEPLVGVQTKVGLASHPSIAVTV